MEQGNLVSESRRMKRYSRAPGQLGSTENVVVDNACDSAILRAIADKLIPGIAPTTRISMLQQTTFQEQEQALPDLSSLVIGKSSEQQFQQSALQYVIESDAYRNDYLREVAGTIPRSSFTPFAPN
jgi:hypothetical protein